VTAPDPMKGVRGVFAATLVLEAVVVLLALLVFARFGRGPAPVGFAVITALALLMIVAAGLQRRSLGLGLALALQVATIVAGFLLTVPLGVVGVVFALVWVGLLLLRRDLAGKQARGELPAQRPRDP
jgi:chromate transport protein ChrA